MQDLKNTYASILERYDDLINAIKAQESEGRLTRVYATHDVFSLEPFYQEMNDISSSKMKTYSSKEKLPKGLDIYECLLEGNAVVYTRHTDYVDLIKDSFFVYKSGERWKYEFYISSSNQSLAGVQCLKLDDSGNPKSFRFFNQFGSYKRVYEHNGSVTNIFSSSTSSSGESKTRVFFDEDRNNIIKIELLGKDGNLTVYELKDCKPNEKLLLKKIKNIIVDTIFKTLNNNEVVTEEIAFILLEYDFNFPFPPFVGLCQTKEREMLSKEYGPIAAYGTAEMEYASENQNPRFDFESQSGARSLFEAVAKLINYNHEYGEKKQLIIDTYIDICVTLMGKKEILNSIRVAKDFHIVANDTGEMNVAVYLEALLPEKQYKTLVDSEAKYNR